jgi:tetratricopeptide (TPR) repeat protein
MSDHYDIFISYAQRDAKYVEDISSTLRDAGFRVWLDTWEIAVGASWNVSIGDAIGSASAVVICFGKGGMSKRQLLECNLAVSKELIVLLLPGADPRTLPAPLSAKMRVDLSSGHHDEKAISNLVGHLHKIIGTDNVVVQQRTFGARAVQVSGSNNTVILAEALASPDRLSQLGQGDQALVLAQEAVGIRRAQAAQHPALLPDLAPSLSNLAVVLSELGRREEALGVAQEAAALYRTLAAQRPDAFLPDLAASLNNLANRQSELGRRDQALALAEEAVHIRRTLAAQRPDAFLPDLAASLNNLAVMHSELGRRDQALALAEEAVHIRRTLAAQRPDAFLPDLAASLNNLANRQSELGRRDQALALAEEAVQIRRTLAAQRPDVFLPDLAASLNNLAVMQSVLGRRNEALALAKEAAYLLHNS